MSTGWWGIPGETDGTKTHFTFDGRYPKPACGVRLGPLMHYQWCAAGFNVTACECRRCQKIGVKVPRITIRRNTR